MFHLATYSGGLAFTFHFTHQRERSFQFITDPMCINSVDKSMEIEVLYALAQSKTHRRKTFVINWLDPKYM